MRLAPASLGGSFLQGRLYAKHVKLTAGGQQASGPEFDMLAYAILVSPSPTIALSYESGYGSHRR